MSTIYTLNGKVLKNAANDKWLTKKEAPAGFVMNASNATYTSPAGTSSIFVSWQSPTYPSSYDGNGKQYILVNNNNSLLGGTSQLMYSDEQRNGGPSAININDMQILGTSTGTLIDNPAGTSSNYGKYLSWAFSSQTNTLEQVQAYMANVSITITDP